MANDLETKVEREGNVTTITKPEGKYTVIYGHHEIQQNPKQIPNNTNAIFLELVNPHMYSSPEVLIERCKTHKQYSHMMSKLEDKKIALYFPDISIRYVNKTIRKLNFAYPLEFADSYCVLRLLDNDIFRLLKKQGNSKLLCKEKKELTSKLASFGDIYLDIAYKIEPKTTAFFFTLRNLLISHKMDWFAKNFNVNTTLLIGAFHRGIENCLQYDSEQRINKIEKMNTLITGEINSGNLVPDSVYKLIRFDYDGNEWKSEIYEIPELKELIAK